MPEIVIVIPGGAAVRLESTRVVIGRDDSCDVQVLEAGVSRRHAELVAERGSWVLCDLDSHNGTWLRGARIEGPEVVRPGVEIRLAHDGPVIRIAATTLGTAPEPPPEATLRSPPPSPPAPPSPVAKRGPGARKLIAALCVAVALAGVAWFVLDRDSGDGDGEERAAVSDEGDGPTVDPVRKRATAASMEELARDALARDGEARSWAADAWHAFRPVGPLRLSGARPEPHEITPRASLLLTRGGLWVGGTLAGRDRPLLIRLFDEEREVDEAGATLVAVGAHPDAMVALLTDADRRQALGMKFRCIIRAGVDYPAILDGPPASPAPRAGGELELVDLPRGGIDLETEAAHFTSAIPDDAPTRVPAVVWEDGAQAATAAEIEGERIALFRRRGDRTDVCGRIVVARELRPIRHVTERFEFNTVIDVAAGAAIPAIGNATAAYGLGGTR